MQLFYAPNILKNEFVLSPEESAHCVRVLRKKNGDEINLFDGNGCVYKAAIIDDNPKKCSFDILSSELKAKVRDFRIHIAIAPTKNIERFEWFVEKATEIGIDEISPIFCDQSERTVVKNERIEKVILSAVKQSLKFYFPKLNEPIKFKDFIKKTIEEQKFIAHCNEPKDSLKGLCNKGRDVIILIGPEGDFSEKEIKQAIENGFKEVSLGEARLRTETAGVVACHTINLMNS